MLRKVMGMQAAWIQELLKKKKEAVPALTANSSLEKRKEASTVAKRHNSWSLSSSQKPKIGSPPFGKLEQLFFLTLKAMSIVNKENSQTQRQKKKSPI